MAARKRDDVGIVPYGMTEGRINGTSRAPSPTEYVKSDKRDSFHHLRWSPFLKEEGRDVGAPSPTENEKWEEAYHLIEMAYNKLVDEVAFR